MRLSVKALAAQSDRCVREALMKLGGDLLLVGCGKMGGAMLEGWLGRGLPAGDVAVVEPNTEIGAALNSRGLRHVANADALPLLLRPAVVLLAVKPQMMDGAVAGIARFVNPSTLFLSIAAGKTLAYFSRHLGEKAAVIRAMP